MRGLVLLRGGRGVQLVEGTLSSACQLLCWLHHGQFFSDSVFQLSVTILSIFGESRFSLSVSVKISFQ